MSTKTYPFGSPLTRFLSISALAVGVAGLTGCTTVEKAPVQQLSIGCTFLGPDCARLQTGGDDQAAQRYVNPKAQWTQYNKVLIAPVVFYGGENTRISAGDQQALVNFFHEQLIQQLGGKFQVVDKAGPDVMKIAVAMTDAESATPVLRSVSMIVPQAHMLSNLKYLATGSFPFVGAAEVAGRVTDAATGQTLAAFADRRIGGGSFTTGFQWQWGDAENAIKGWAEKLTERLSAWTGGTATP